MMKLQRFAIGCFGLLLALTALAALPAAADDYPNRPIRLIIPFPPGGSNDVVGRIIANQLGQSLGRQVFVDNRAGAGGVLGTDLVAKATPDGYTLLIISIAHAVNPWLYKLNYDPAKDFVPVSIIATGTNVLTVNPQVPVHSVKELLDLARQQPGVLNYASAGIGSFQHLSGELFKLMAGVNIQHVPYRGGGPSMLAVIAGEDQVMFSSIVQTVPSIKSGQLRALATGGAERSPILPDLPSIGEAGVPGYVATNWWGHHRAGRHAPAGRRQAPRHDCRAAQLRGNQEVSRQRRRRCGAHELGRIRQVHRGRDRQVGPGGQAGRHEGGVILRRAGHSVIARSKATKQSRPTLALCKPPWIASAPKRPRNDVTTT
jgi:tripartite-type tricarboxylate transporter receptor subunit TctC